MHYLHTVKLCSHIHKCKSEYPYMSFNKHEFACVSMAVFVNIALLLVHPLQYTVKSFINIT